MIVIIIPDSLSTLVPKSVLSLQHVQSAHVCTAPSHYRLSRITTYGVRSCTLNIGLRRTFRLVFIIANVKQAILGADFLHHFGLVVDVRHRTLLDSTTHLRVNGLASSLSSGITRTRQDTNNPFLSLLSDFPGVTEACIANLPIKHSVTHHITTTGPPVSSRTRRLAPERLCVARQEFDHMLELGIIRPSSSSCCIWCRNVLLVIGDLVGIFVH